MSLIDFDGDMLRNNFLSNSPYGHLRRDKVSPSEELSKSNSLIRFGDVNEFQNYLREKDIDVLSDVGIYQHPTFINEDKLFACLDEIFSKNLRALLHPDCDPDGLFSCLEFTELSKSFNYKNYEIWDYKNRDHGIDIDFVQKAIEEKFDYVVIFDAGSNDMENIEKLCIFGVKVIIIDHHVSYYDYDSYPSDCTIVNSVMNNNVDPNNYYVLSAGALTFTLFYKYASTKCKFLNNLAVYALITLYSDCIDMSEKLNRQIYQMAVNVNASYLPRFVRDFLGKTVFRRRFIEFTLVPKINAMFRAEQFDLINKYFFDFNLSSFEYNNMVTKITNIHEQSRKLVDMVTDVIDRIELDNFVLANLTNCDLPVHVHKLYNYTGVIANNLAQEYGKPCIVLCDNGKEVKGSFRDLLGRNYLGIFNQFCDCGGHPAAFGIHVPYVDVEYFTNMISNVIDKKFYLYGLEDNLLINMNDSIPNVQLLEAIATYNEFSGVSLPVAVISKRHLMKELSSYNRSMYRYKWGDLNVESQYKLVRGSYVKIKPVWSKNLKLVSYLTGN